MKLKELVEKYGEYDVRLIETPKGQESEWARVHLLKPKPKTVWDLEKGDNHHWVDSLGKVKYNYTWEDDKSYELSREIGNVFLTQEDAEKDVERRKVETLLLKFGGRRWFKVGEMNWRISYNHSLDEWSFLYSASLQGQGAIYFDTKEQAQNAVKEIGEEHLKKALFEVR